MTLVDEIRRVWAAFALMWLDPWNRDAVAALLAGLTHDDVTVQNEAIVVLHRLGGGAKLQPIDDPIVETLVMTLLVPIENRRDGYTQGLALTILERLGPAAASARPALRTMLENAEEVTWRHRLQMTLSAIDSAR
jgi:HEAT repeat protein